MSNVVFKALADPTRREILRLLGGGELSAGQLAQNFDMSKPSMSHHFAVLKQADLIQSRREGQQIFYALNTTVMEDLLTWLWDAFGAGGREKTREKVAMTRAYWGASIALVVLAWATAVGFYPQLPARIPTHWNIHGEIDGYGAKAWAAFLMPIAMLAPLLLFCALPWLSPRSFEVDRFRSTYALIVTLILVLMCYIHGLTLWAGLFQPLDMGAALMTGICICLALIGNVLGKVRRNFYVGVRTPWTLASERVWTDTHRLAARLMVLAGALGAVVALTVDQVLAFAIPFGLIMAAALVPVIYSLVHYKRLERRGEL